MRGIAFKLVAVALALVVLAPPGAALVACLQHGGTAPMSCCATMKAHSAPAAQVAARHSRPCCEIRSGRPVAPLASSAAPTAVAQIAPTTTVSAIAADAGLAHHGEQDPVPTGDRSSPQAVLCTFLI